MTSNFQKVLVLLPIIAFMFGCAKVEYTNPLDPKSPSYVGADSSADDDGDHIANIYDKDSKYYKVDKDTPTIEILGDNPKTLYYKASEKSKFDAEIEKLKGEINCYDASDKTVDKSDVNVTHNINYSAGEYEMIYSVSDTSNNYRKVTRKVIVELTAEDDKTPPSISPSTFYVVKDTAIIEKGTDIPDSAFLKFLVIYDADGSKFEIGKNVKKEGDVNTNQVGVYKVKFTAIDKSENDSSCTIYFNVTQEITSTDAVLTVSYNNKDMKHGDKIIDTLPDIEFNYDKFQWDAYEFVNNEKVDLHDKVEHPCDYVADKDGNYTAEFYVKGSNGIEKRINVYIVIKPKGGDKPLCDTTIEMKLIGSDTVRLTVGQEYEEQGVTARRFPGNVDVSNKVEISPKNPSTAVENTIPIVYSIRNTCGTTSVTRILIVKAIVDNEPPKIYLKPSRMNDSVAEGSKYSSLKYKSLTDVIDSVVDNVDGRININKVKIDSSGFKTDEAGKPCSLVYLVKDAKGLEGKAVRKIIVVDASTFGLLQKYGVPTSSPLPAVDGNFTSKTSEVAGGGSGPNLSTITQFSFNWNLSGKQLNNFSFNLSVSPNYVDLKTKVTHNFDSPSPKFKLTGSGISGLDGEYYVKYDNSQLIWVKIDGTFAITWKK